MNITIEIKAPELAKAIEALAIALSGNSVQNLAVALNGKELAQATNKAAKEEKAPEPEKPVSEPDPAKEEKAAREEITAGKDEVPAIKLETVRATLAKLSQSGKQAQVKAIITDIGKAKKLTEIDTSLYAEVLAAAEAIA